MNREIKFRAWDKDRKKMIYSFADKLNMKGYVLLWSTDNDRLFCGNYMDNGDWQEPELMQFTGLKDKNGKEIYEGDVITCGKSICSVGWEDGGFAFCNNKNWLDEWNWADDSHRFKVIGNIYENPELIN